MVKISLKLLQKGKKEKKNNGCFRPLILIKIVAIEISCRFTCLLKILSRNLMFYIKKITL